MMSRRNVRHSLLGVVVAGACGLCGTARAQSEYTFAYFDSITSAAGWLRTNADPLSNGGFSVTGGVLNVTAGPLVGTYELVPNAGAPGTAYSPKGKFVYDSVLFPQAATNLDSYGLLFVGHGHEVNIWGDGDAALYSLWSWKGSKYDYSNDGGSFVLIASGGTVPAPGTSAVALVAVVFVTRRRRHTPR